MCASHASALRARGAHFAVRMSGTDRKERSAVSERTEAAIVGLFIALLPVENGGLAVLLRSWLVCLDSGVPIGGGAMGLGRELDRTGRMRGCPVHGAQALFALCGLDWLRSCC